MQPRSLDTGVQDPAIRERLGLGTGEGYGLEHGEVGPQPDGDAAGRMPESPFTSTELEKGQAFLEKWAAVQGHQPTPDADDIEQAPRLRLMQALLRGCRDPDAEALDAYCGGVRLGYLQRMPRTPAVIQREGALAVAL